MTFPDSNGWESGLPSAVEPFDHWADGRSSWDLHLHRRAKLRTACWHDREIARLCFNITLHELPNRTDGIDDRRTSGVRHEGLQRLQCARAIRVLGERKDVGLLRLQSGHRCFQHLDQALIEQRDAGGRIARLRSGSREGKMCDLAREAE